MYNIIASIHTQFEHIIYGLWPHLHDVTMVILMTDYIKHRIEVVCL